MDCALQGVPAAVSYLKDQRISELDAVLVTHLDADHYAGVPELIRQVPAKLYGYGYVKGYSNAHTGVDAFLRRMYDDLERTSATYKRPLKGLVLDAPGIHIEVLGPTDAEELRAQTRNNANFASVMLLVRVGGLTALLAGDCPPWRWSRVLSEHPAQLLADVFVIPHHGAAHGSTPRSLRAVLDAVSPSVIVISVGSRNRYGHPRRLTLDTAAHWAASNGARLVCTQLNEYCRANIRGKGQPNTPCAGDIVIEHDGAGLLVSVGRPAHPSFVETLAAPRCLRHNDGQRQHLALAPRSP